MIHKVLSAGNVDASNNAESLNTPDLQEEIRDRIGEFNEQEYATGCKLRTIFEQTFKALYLRLLTVSILDMPILGQVRGVKEDIDLVIEKKEVIEDLLGKEMGNDSV